MEKTGGLCSGNVEFRAQFIIYEKYKWLDHLKKSKAFHGQTPPRRNTKSKWALKSVT